MNKSNSIIHKSNINFHTSSLIDSPQYLCSVCVTGSCEHILSHYIYCQRKMEKKKNELQTGSPLPSDTSFSSSEWFTAITGTPELPAKPLHGS